MEWRSSVLGVGIDELYRRTDPWRVSPTICKRYTFSDLNLFPASREEDYCHQVAYLVP